MIRTHLIVCLPFMVGLIWRCGLAPAQTTASVERRTAAQCLEVVRAETAQRRQWESEHPAETKLLLGAALEVAPAMSKAPADLQRWPAKYREAYETYQAWWKVAGQDAWTKWRAPAVGLRTSSTLAAGEAAILACNSS